ncbi:MAG: DUF2066 domain-containing protein [Rhodospirillaceae bacterium]
MLNRLGAVVLAAALVSVVAPGPAAAQQTQPPSPVAGAAQPIAASSVAPEDPYNIGGVEVDITASSGAEAREKAILEAQRKAFNILFKRLAADADSRIPPGVSDSDLQRMIQGFQIDRERVSSVRYIGSLSIKFRRTAVRPYLSGLGIRIIEPSARSGMPPATTGTAATTVALPTVPPPTVTQIVAKPTVVLPVLMGKTVNILWEERTPWRTAWEDFAAGTSAAKLAVPLGELGDIADIGANEAVAGNATALAKIAGHYDGGDVLVATLPGSERIDPVAGVQIGLGRFSADGRPRGAPETLTIQGAAGEQVQAFLSRTVSAVVARLASMPNGGSDGVTTPPPPPPPLEGQLQVGVAVSGMQDWLEVRRRLTSNPMIVAADTVSLTRSRVAVMIRYRGELDGLRAMLERDGLTLAQSPTGWSLYPRSSVQTAPVPGLPRVSTTPAASEYGVQPPATNMRP